MTQKIPTCPSKDETDDEIFDWDGKSSCSSESSSESSSQESIESLKLTDFLRSYRNQKKQHENEFFNVDQVSLLDMKNILLSIKNEFKCELCGDTFKDPVKLHTCEHTFCRLCILKHEILNGNKCPLCKIPRLDVIKKICTDKYLENIVRLFGKQKYNNELLKTNNDINKINTKYLTVMSIPQNICFYPMTIRVNIFENKWINMIKECINNNKLFIYVSPELNNGSIIPYNGATGCICKIISCQALSEKMYIINAENLGQIRLNNVFERKFPSKHHVSDYTYYEDKINNNILDKKIQYYIMELNEYITETFEEYSKDDNIEMQIQMDNKLPERIIPNDSNIMEFSFYVAAFLFMLQNKYNIQTTNWLYTAINTTNTSERIRLCYHVLQQLK